MKNRISVLALLLLPATPVFAQVPGTVRSRPPVAEILQGRAWAIGELVF